MTHVIVVTGANGFVGSHVVSLAAQSGHTVWAIGREASPQPAVRRHADRYISADLTLGWPVEENVDAIIHLAGLAAVGPSFASPQRYIDVNSRIMTNVGEALLSTSARTRTVVVSSGAVYAPTDTGMVDEASATAASSPYVVAKLLIESQAQYYASRGLDMLVARPFNHIGPGQGPGFIVPDLSAAVMAVAPGESVPTGNLNAARDYTDVRDVARAYILLASALSHQHAIYNISTGEPRTGEEILSVISQVLGRGQLSTIVDNARVRPNDPSRISGDSTRLRREFGWHPTIPWSRSILDYATDLASGEPELDANPRAARKTHE